MNLQGILGYLHSYSQTIRVYANLSYGSIDPNTIEVMIIKTLDLENDSYM